MIAEKEKKIIFFTGTLSSGGAERVISIITKKLIENDLPVEIVTFYDESIFYTIDPRIKVVSVVHNTQSNNLIVNIIWLRKYLKANAMKVISFLASFNILAIVARIGLNIPIIVADRNDPRFIPINLFVRNLRDFFYRFADLVVLQTEMNNEYFTRFIKKTKIIPNPIDLSEFEGSYLGKNHYKEIVTVGRLIPAKNQMMLLKAFAAFHNTHREYNLVIYGEGPERTILQKKAVELKIEKYVSMPGRRKDVLELITNSEVFVLSSDYEGMPNVLIEAMCLGMPVISTMVSGATELIDNGNNGLLVECGNAKAMTEALVKMIEDRNFRLSCATQATKIKDKLNVDKIAGSWLTIINEI